MMIDENKNMNEIIDYTGKWSKRLQKALKRGIITKITYENSIISDDYSIIKYRFVLSDSFAQKAILNELETKKDDINGKHIYSCS